MTELAAERIPSQPAICPLAFRCAAGANVNRGGRPWNRAGRRACRPNASYQDLATGHQFAGSYDTVKRFVRRLAAQVERPFVRMEVEPGAGAQVDSGLGAWVLVDGKRKLARICFRIVLSHSRKAYSEVVWRQTTGSFIRCLENAFCYFGSVLKTLAH